MVRSVCDELGVYHFTRHQVERYNQPRGRFKARSKHGNYNAWVDRHGDEYEFFVSVDPDHVPQANFCERLLGYFRDPDVAFVVGPQVYGNYDNFVTKGAESQQFVFHGLIQRMGNFFGCPMLVGTNNAVRISALREIGGLRDSITEDLATSLSFHSTQGSRPDATGDRCTRPTCSPSARARRTSPTSSPSSIAGAGHVRELPRPLLAQPADAAVGAAAALLADHLLLPDRRDRLGAGGRQLRDLPDPRRPRRRDQPARLDRRVRRPGVRSIRAIRVQPPLQRLAARRPGLVGSGRHVHVGDGRSGLCGRVHTERARPLELVRRHPQGRG